MLAVANSYFVNFGDATAAWLVFSFTSDVGSQMFVTIEGTWLSMHLCNMHTGYMHEHSSLICFFSW